MTDYNPIIENLKPFIVTNREGNIIYRRCDTREEAQNYADFLNRSCPGHLVAERV